MSEEEIIKEMESLSPSEKAIQGLLDLYNNTKKSELILANKFQKVNIELNKEKEKNKKIEDKIKMETNRLKEHGYWEFLEQRDLDKTISIIQNLLEE